MQLRAVEFLSQTVIGFNFDLLLSVQKVQVHVDSLQLTFEIIIIDVSSQKTKVRKESVCFVGR